MKTTDSKMTTTQFESSNESLTPYLGKHNGLLSSAASTGSDESEVAA